MKLQEILEELESKEFHKEFMKTYPNSFFSAGFFIFDLKNKSEQIHLDFFIPELKKLASFEFPFKEAKIHEEEFLEATIQGTDLKVDIDEVASISLDVIKKNESGLRPTKIIGVIQKDFWNLTCMDDMLGIIRIKVDALTGKELSFDKGSLMDFMGIKKNK